MEVYKKYYETAKNYLIEFDNITELHIIDIVTSVLMTRDGVGYPGGSFVRAVVENNLYEAITRADATCLRYLPAIVSAKMWA